MTHWMPNYLPSNGTDGDHFSIGPMGCKSCTVDHDSGYHGPNPEGGDSCPILLKALTCYPDPGPVEWERTDYVKGEGAKTRCTAWQGPCSCTEGTTYQPPAGVYLEGLS